MITKDDSKNAIWLAYCDLRADYEQLSKERDQLLNEVKVLKSYLKVLNYPEHGHVFTHEQLIEHDAQVIDETINYMQKHYPSLCVEGAFTGGWLKALRKRANQLRQKAQENNV